MTENEQDAVEAATLRLNQITRNLSVIRTYIAKDHTASEALALVETFAEWTSEKLYDAFFPIKEPDRPYAGKTWARPDAASQALSGGGHGPC